MHMNIVLMLQHILPMKDRFDIKHNSKSLNKLKRKCNNKYIIHAAAIYIFRLKFESDNLIVVTVRQ